MSRALTQHGLKAAVKTDACSTLVSLNIFAGTEHDSANYGKVQESFRKHTAETANKGRAPPKGGVKYSKEYSGKNVEWAVKNGIITKEERISFFHKIADIKKLGHKYRQTKNGDYIVDLGEKLLFTDADWYSPSLNMVVSFNDSFENSMLYAKEIVFNEAKTEADYNRARQIIEDIYWPGYVEFSYSHDYRANVRENTGRERENSQRNNGENVKFSMEAPIEDSNGRRLTNAQREFFKDSKAIDSNGRLLTLYHGTGAKFTVFDKAHIGENFGNRGGDLGFYFSPYIEDAKGYAREAAGYKGKGEVMPVYLNLKNPLIIEDDGWGSAISQTDIRHGDLKRWAEEGKHDGIIIKSTDEIDENDMPDAVYIAFSPEQIKNVTNENPTSNPDIRYSREPERLNELRRQNERKLAQATAEDAANENERGLIKDYKRQYDKVSGIAEKLNTARQEVLTAERSGGGNTTAKKKIKKHRTHCPVFGRGRRLRTLGLRFWRPPLYQLSYSPIKLVGLQGLEPQTDRL